MTTSAIVMFRDEKPWDLDLVEKHAVFAGIRVVVDGKFCHSMPFCRGEAAYYENPGCRIEVANEISNYHRAWSTHWYQGRVLVNFHGQVVQLDYWPGKHRQGLTILVDIAEQTDIRLMLPARTILIENAASVKLKEAIELEYYKYFQKQKTHALYYEEYQRAKELGIELPEAQPQYKAGLIWGECDEPVEVVMPKDFKLEECYLCFNDDCDDDIAEANAHLLAALGDFKSKPFVPVTIDSSYMGYSWTKLPKVTKVEVSKGKELLRHSINCGEIVCFDKLSITVRTSDGKTFTSDVDMAVIIEETNNRHHWVDETVCVTRRARNCLDSGNIWFHLGGYSDEGDSYDTQLYYFEKELQELWDKLVGPYESLRGEIASLLSGHYGLCGKWQKITILEDRSLEILFKDGRKEQVKPPVESA